MCFIFFIGLGFYTTNKINKIVKPTEEFLFLSMSRLVIWLNIEAFQPIFVDQIEHIITFFERREWGVVVQYKRFGNYRNVYRMVDRPSIGQFHILLLESAVYAEWGKAG